MRFCKATAVLAAMLLLSGCQSTAPQYTAPEVQNGYPTAEAAYTAYLEVCRATDAEVLCSMFSADEIAAAPGVSREFLGVKEENYALYLYLLDQSNFRKSMDGYMNTLRENMDANTKKGDTWSIVPGSEETGAKASDFAQATGLNVKGLVHYNYYFLQNDREDGASVAGKKVSVVKIGDLWYPSYIYEITTDDFFSGIDTLT